MFTQVFGLARPQLRDVIYHAIPCVITTREVPQAMGTTKKVTALADLEVGQEGEFFAVLSSKEELKTRDGKPYFRVTFRDARRQVSFPIWIDSRWGEECRHNWVVGRCYRLRAMYQESAFGPELNIRHIEEYCPERDKDLLPELVFGGPKQAPAELFAQLRRFVDTQLQDAELKQLVLTLLDQHRAKWCHTPASTRLHYAYPGGLLFHTLRVAENAAMLAEAYAKRLQENRPLLDPSLVVAGAVLHDIGKLLELDSPYQPDAESAAGGLIGHLVLGRDLLREAARHIPINPEKLLRLEHILLSHHGQADLGAVRPPMTLEALLVQYANDLDVRFELVRQILMDKSGGLWTSDRNPLRQRFYRGSLPLEDS